VKIAADRSEKPEHGVEDVLLDAGQVQQAPDVLTQWPLHGSEEGERVEPCTTPLANLMVKVTGSMVGMSSAGVGSPNGMDRS
jgi:hypothetical protein